jgi:hypothetical protein
MKDLVVNQLISCRFDLVGSEHETQEGGRGLVGDATMEKSRSKCGAQPKLPTSILARDRLQSCHFPSRL